MTSDTYKRFEFTDDGVSPRTIPGYKNTLFLASGSESDDRGVITENKANRNRKMEKRALKLATFSNKERATYPFVDVVGDKAAKVGIITWGSTTAAVDEATERLTDLKTKRMSLKVLWPFPAQEVKDFMAGCDKVFVVESNFSGQLAGLIKKEVGGHGKIESILKYDGTPFRPAEIIKDIQEGL
jgi:2-oxoglutarate ferredoxin oxidoreductase subunit alpha